MAAGYEIGLSGSDSLVSGVSGSFSVTGGGGSPLTSLIDQANSAKPSATSTTTPASVNYAVIGAVLAGVALIAWLIFRKD